MNRILRIIPLACLLVVMGCATTQQHSAYVTVGALTEAVQQARLAYSHHVNTCVCVTESEVAKVEAVYNKYSAAAKVVQDVVNSTANGNPDVLVQISSAVAASAGDVLQLIEQLLPANETAKLKTSLPKGVAPLL